MSSDPEQGVEVSATAAAHPAPRSLLSRRRVLRRLGVVGLVAGTRLVLPGVGSPLAPRLATASTEPLVTSGGMTQPVETSIPFSLVGFELLGDDETIEFRTSAHGESWTPWTVTRRIAAVGEGPTPGDREDVSAWRRMTQPVWVGEARWLQVRSGTPTSVRAHLVDSAGLSRSLLVRTAETALAVLAGDAPAAHATPFSPGIIMRAEWGADESWRNGSPHLARAARFAVIHHTATGNDYAREEVPAILRGIYRYHTHTLGWDDIGYNFLVDRFGRVFEGRAGGVDRPVIGAHAAGHNDGSIGVAVLGCHDRQACDDPAVPAPAVEGLDRLVAWKFAYHGIDPLETTRQEETTTSTIIGHREVGSTACPGDDLFEQMHAEDSMHERVFRRVHRFRDVPATSRFAWDIAWLAAAGITRGCNPPDNDRFCPTDPVTRQQMAAFLTRALDLRDDTHPGFRDVPPDAPFARDIRRIAAAGITRGCNPPDNDLFCPTDPVTRQQMAAFLTRALGPSAAGAA